LTIVRMAARKKKFLPGLSAIGRKYISVTCWN
jgi:hypothetical protein